MSYKERIRERKQHKAGEANGKPESPVGKEPTIVPGRTSAVPWPVPLGKQAFHGLAGEFVRIVEPHTESDPAALLTQFLTFYGNAAGRASYFPVEANWHRPNEFLVILGDTSKARKGTSAQHVRRVFEMADPIWTQEKIVSGLSSGEGLIAEIRDPTEGEGGARTNV